MTAPDHLSPVAVQKRFCARVAAAPRMMLGRFYPSPSWLVGGSLTFTAFLFTSERYQWFFFNQHRGWTVLIALAGMGAVLLLISSWFILAVILRGRFQYRLSTLLALVVVIALPLSWLDVEKERAARERQMARVMEESYCYAYQCVFYGNRLEPNLFSPGRDFYHTATGRINAFDKPSEPQWLRDWLGEDFFCSILAFGVEGQRAKTFTVDDFRRVVALPYLKRLMLDDAKKLTDADFAEIRRKRGLERLFLRGTRITDQGLRELSSLTNLRVLSLAYTEVTDDGLTYLQGMAKLEVLELIGTDISDEGLQHLRGLTALRYLLLYCDGTKVTEKGLQELKTALPNCNCLPVVGDLRRPEFFW
jgi:hypothetical protein